MGIILCTFITAAILSIRVDEVVGRFNRLLNFLAYFHGNMTVEVEFASDGSVTVLDNVCAIDPDESVIHKLCDIVGEDNVRFL